MKKMDAANSGDNNDILQNRRVIVHDTVQCYMDLYRDPQEIAPVDLISLLCSDESSAKKMERLEAMRDGVLNISHIIEGDVLIRDARRAIQYTAEKHKKCQATTLSNLMQLLDFAEAGEIACKIDGINPDAIDKARQMIRDRVLSDIAKKYNIDSTVIDTSPYNAAVLSIFEQIGLKDAVHKMTNGMYFRNIENAQMHVVTITSHEQKDGEAIDIVEADIMLNSITDKQRIDYQKIKDTMYSNPSSISPNYSAKTGIAWYDELPVHQKGLVTYYIDRLIAGAIVPTQLRGILPGIKNAHSKEVMYISENANGFKCNQLGQSVHMGTLSFHGPCSMEHKLSVVQDNIDQIKSFLPDGSTISDITLVSPINFLDIEGEIMEQLNQLAERDKTFSRSVTPLNGLRYISKNYMEGYDHIFKTISDALQGDLFKSDLCDVKHYIKTGDGIKKALDEIQEISEIDLAYSQLTRVIEARQLMDKNLFISDADNRNLQLAVAMKSIVSDIHSDTGFACMFGEELRKKIPYLLSHCKSGKDRDGVLEVEFTLQSATKIIGKEDTLKILKTIVNGAHAQFMASTNGGCRGAHGLKKSSRSALPSYYAEVKDDLMIKSAENSRLKFGSKELLIDREALSSLSLEDSVENPFMQQTLKSTIMNFIKSCVALLFDMMPFRNSSSSNDKMRKIPALESPSIHDSMITQNKLTEVCKQFTEELVIVFDAKHNNSKDDKSISSGHNQSDNVGKLNKRGSAFGRG